MITVKAESLNARTASELGLLALWRPWADRRPAHRQASGTPDGCRRLVSSRVAERMLFYSSLGGWATSGEVVYEKAT